MSEKRELTIPGNMLVRCPKHKFNMVRVTECVDCDSHKGFAERMKREDIAFNEQYINLCNFEPVKREMYELK